jgi:hypothetical protein
MAYNKDQMLMIKSGRILGLDTRYYEDPDYTADRMSAIIETLKLGVPHKDLVIMLDKNMSDKDAWNLWFWLSLGRTAESFILSNDMER